MRWGPALWRVAEPPMPAWRPEWSALARYNAERNRGLVHTVDWDARMAEVQREFDEAHYGAFGAQAR